MLLFIFMYAKYIHDNQYIDRHESNDKCHSTGLLLFTAKYQYFFFLMLYPKRLTLSSFLRPKFNVNKTFSQF